MKKVIAFEAFHHNGKVTHYQLIQLNGHAIEVDTDEVKRLLKSGEIEVANLTLSKDNKLIKNKTPDILLYKIISEIHNLNMKYKVTDVKLSGINAEITIRSNNPLYNICEIYVKNIPVSNFPYMNEWHNINSTVGITLNNGSKIMKMMDNNKKLQTYIRNNLDKVGGVELRLRYKIDADGSIIKSVSKPFFDPTIKRTEINANRVTEYGAEEHGRIRRLY